MLIGYPQELSKELKIKELVDLAGLSPLKLLLNLKNSSKEVLLDLSLNNNSTHVIPLLIMDALEEEWIGL